MGLVEGFAILTVYLNRQRVSDCEDVVCSSPSVALAVWMLVGLVVFLFRTRPQLFGTLSLTSLPSEFFYAHNREGKTPADLLPLLLPPYVEELRELQKTAAAELQRRAEFQDQVALVSCNLRAWRSVVFEYAAKASSLF